MRDPARELVQLLRPPLELRCAVFGVKAALMQTREHPLEKARSKERGQDRQSDRDAVEDDQQGPGSATGRQDLQSQALSLAGVELDQPAKRRVELERALSRQPDDVVVDVRCHDAAP